MWAEIYAWIEQYSGVSYDLNEDINEIKGDVAFIETFFWATKISMIIDNLDEALSVVDEHYYDLTDDLPDANTLKKMLTTDVLAKILEQVVEIKRQLGISAKKINTVTDLLQHVNTMRDLIEMLKENNMEDIVKQRLFDKYNEENDDAFTELLDLHKNDMTNMWDVVHSVVDNETDDDEDYEVDDEDDEIDEE